MSNKPKDKIAQLEGLLSNAKQILKELKMKPNENKCCKNISMRTNLEDGKDYCENCGQEVIIKLEHKPQEIKEDWLKEWAHKILNADTEYDAQEMLKLVLSHNKEELIREFIGGKRCLSCGGKKKPGLTDMCDKCLENA